MVTAPPRPPDEAVDPGLARRVFNGRTLLSFAIGLALVVFLVTRVQIDVGRTFGAIARADPLLMLLALGVYYLVFPFRGLRWRVMLRNAGVEHPPSGAQLGLIVLLSWFANCVVPAKLGDVYRAFILRKHSGLSLSMIGGTILAERVIDLSCVLVLLGGTALFSFSGRLPGELVPLLEVGVAALLVAGVAVFALRRWDTFLLRFLPGRLHGIYERFHGGAVGSFGRYPLLILYTPLCWIPEIVRFWLVARAVGLALGDGGVALQLSDATFVALGSAVFTTAVPTPGGLGGAELAIVGALHLLDTTGALARTPELVIAAALLDRVISYWSLIVFGLIAYLLTEARPKAPAPLLEHARRD